MTSKLKITNLMRLIILSIVTLIFIALYILIKMNFEIPKLTIYQFNIRIEKVVAIIIAGFAIGSASIVFQSVINNNIVTPCILGMNSLYTLVHTLIAFFVGTSSIFFLNQNLNFGINLLIMVILSYVIYGFMFKKTKYNVLYILLIGTVLSSLFGSIQTTLVRIMDPNEYDTLLTSLTASFENINSEIMLLSIGLLFVVGAIFFKEIMLLDVITLGKNQAISLGVDYEKTTRKLLIFVTLYLAIATAMIGPISFLGLITANITRQLFKTYKHKYLISGTILTSIIVLLIGQILVERVFTYSVPVSIFITIGGGVYFLYLIIKNRRK